MKLLNQSIKYLSVSILFIISFWAVIFYFSMLDKIKGSLDEGLENYKRQIIYNVQSDSTLINKIEFDESFFSIREISRVEALRAKDQYLDTLMYMQDANDVALELEPARMLITTFKNKGRYYELSIINSMVEQADLIRELFWQVLWLYAMLVISLIVINNMVLKRLWKPFYDLLSQFDNFRLGKSKVLPGVKTKTKEFNDLQYAANSLLKHILKTYKQQKQFIGNASHELQTPLAIATNKLELLIEKGGLEHDQANSIAEVLQIIERLVRLNKSLLLLTRIESKQFLDNKIVSINELVQQITNELDEFAEFKKVTVSVCNTAETVVNMNPSLAHIILSNLIKNAIFHNVPHGEVKIDISEQVIRVINTGKAGPLNAEKIFNRFYKSDNEIKSTGLGLAIVKAICELYGFTVSYRFQENKHDFELLFHPNER